MANLEVLKNLFDQDKGLYIAIKRAMNDLYRYDKHLICNEPHERRCPDEIGKHYVGERAIVFRFAHYLQNELVKNHKYSNYHLDCEYNRNGSATKSLLDFPNGTFPDLIIHHRDSNEDNILVMEFKTYWNADIERDRLKVKGFVDKKGKYKYKYGVIVVIGKTFDETTFEVYQ